MNARDELFQLMLGRTTTRAVERIIAAGYSKPRTITTPEELDALPDNSVIEDGAGDVGVVFAGNVWCPETAPIPVRKVARSYLPATVLYEPEPQP